MQISEHDEVPRCMGANFTLLYMGNPLQVIGGIAPGDVICINAQSDMKNGATVVVRAGERNILCRKTETKLGRFYSPLDPSEGRLFTDQDGETMLIGEVVGLIRFFYGIAETENGEDRRQ